MWFNVRLWAFRSQLSRWLTSNMIQERLYGLMQLISLPLFSVFLDSQVPYLEDPNTGVKMFESADIVEYVRKTYAIGQA